MDWHGNGADELIHKEQFMGQFHREPHDKIIGWEVPKLTCQAHTLHDQIVSGNVRS